VKKNGWTLVVEATKEPVTLPMVCRDFRGEDHTVTDGAPPHKPGSTGRIYTSIQESFFPGVVGLLWVKDSDAI
jgi:hypothetical protein